MAIQCPYCQSGLPLKNVKPGRFQPKCPKCTKTFLLTVPADSSQPMTAKPLPVKVANPDVTAAVLPPAPVADNPDQTAAAISSPAVAAADPDVTGAVVMQQQSAPAAVAKKSVPAKAPPVKPPIKSLPKPAPASADPDVTAALGDLDPDSTGSYQSGAISGAVDTATEFIDTNNSAAEAVEQTGAIEESRPVAVAAKPKKKKSATEADIPDTLGGYQIIKQLGKGGMGAVYLARQTSLDRLVALKTMHPELSGDPTFVARFTREAYAAAQLVHHNVVQIYDIGAEGDTNYFSMEYVQGESLNDLIKRQGKLDPEEAVGYILQAARGLKFGHDLGMVHRDIKPDNLLLNNQGIVKVADLGLVKMSNTEEIPASETPQDTAGSKIKLPGPADMTRVGMAMGTPTYMAPEQAMNSSTVGPAADMYSLGCTLYVLLTGKPPFEGKTVMEVLTKHATAPVIRPDAIVKRVPKALSDILIRMLAKKPADRYPDMDGVIQALEGYLGISRTGPFTPKEEHANTLEECVKQFNEAPRTKVRKLAFLGFFGVTAVLVMLCALVAPAWVAGGFLGLAVLMPLSYFVLQGVRQKTPLFLKARTLLLDAGWKEWLTWTGGFLFALLILWLFGLLWAWIAFCVVAVGVAAGLHFWLDKQVENERAKSLDEAEKLFKVMRLQGLEEEALRQFVCKYSGPKWEEFFEACFGFEAKLKAREWSRGEMGKAREKWGAWREPLLGWIDGRLQARREARERKHLQAVEAKALVAKGVNASEAKARAEEAADLMVHQAAEIKLEAAVRPAAKRSVKDDRAVPEAPKPKKKLKDMMEAARTLEATYATKGATTAKKKTGGGVSLGWIVGPKVRFITGAVLLAGCLIWLNQNNQMEPMKIVKVLASLIPGLEAKALVPLDLPLTPDIVTRWFSTVNAGLAGLLLIGSAFFKGFKPVLLGFGGAALAVVGPFAGPWLGTNELGPVTLSQASAALGILPGVVGAVWSVIRRL